MHNTKLINIEPTWTKRRRTGKLLAGATDVIAMHGANNNRRLEYYVTHGVQEPGEFDHLIKKPADMKGWEFGLASLLQTYALYRLWEFELHSVESGKFDLAIAERAFSACRLVELIAAASQCKAVVGRPGRRASHLHMKFFPYAALGLISGRQKDALALAKLQLLSHRKGYIEKPTSFPVFHFMMRVLADHLGEPPHVPIFIGTPDAICESLYRAWRVLDASTLVPLCLAMLDLHTQLTVYVDDGVERDFQSEWHYTPIEILFLFKLRELEGLPNPTLDHPLMDSPLGVFPHQYEHSTDELLERVRSRMAADGFDENAIISEWGAG